jgi:cytochrome c
MKNSGVTWTPDTLDAYLKKPDHLCEGHQDGVCRLARRKDRADVVAYLGQATK